MKTLTRRCSRLLHRPRAAVLLSTLLGASLSVVLASPATDLFRAASSALTTNYYGWSQADRPALISEYAALLGSECAPVGEGCSFDQGRAVLKKMLTQLGDAHTNVRDQEGAERLREVQEDLTVPRTGVRVVKTPLGLLVVGVMPGSPAEAAGVRRFDLLTRVNDQPLSGGAADPAAFVQLERRRGPITAEAVRAGQTLQLTLSTAPMKASDAPTLSWQQGSAGPVAVIEYPTFLSADSAQLFLRTLRQAQAAGASALVIDLRYNGGGQLNQCVQAASAFLPTLYQARWKSPASGQTTGNRELQTSWEYAAMNGEVASPAEVRRALSQHSSGGVYRTPASVQALWKGPTALLVGEHTASCAEVFGYFAHSAGATLVGQPTKGVMNSGVSFFALPDHGVISVTMLRAYDLNGQPLPERLLPDLEIPDDLEALTARGRDTVLQAALETVQTRLAETH